ncbi:MAG: hypothetical protein WA231_19525 [Methylocella sp.]
MVDAPDNVIFEYLRRLDMKLDHVIEDIGDMKIRMTAVEERIAQVELSIAGVNRRIDRIKRDWNGSSGVSISSNRRIEVTT